MIKPETTYIVTRIRDLQANPPIMPKSVRYTNEGPIKASLTNLCRIVIRTAMGYYDPQAVYVITEIDPESDAPNTWQFHNDRFLG